MPAGLDIQVDTSELEETISRARSVLAPDRFRKVMRRVYRRVGGTVRRSIGGDVSKDYKIGAREAAKDVRKERVNDAGCIIPIEGAHRTVGVQFKATGSAHGWESLHKKYKVRSTILRKKRSVMTGNTFRNVPSKLGDQAFRRVGQKRLPIQKTLALAVPEMVSHHSEERVQDRVLDTMSKRLEHEILYELGKL